MNLNSADDKKRSILAKLPSICEHLAHNPGFHTIALKEQKKHPAQRYLPNLKSRTRVKLKFSSNPFPHLDTVVTDPDTHLEKMQKESEQRREPYPHMGSVKVREGDIPNILEPSYGGYEKQVNQAFELLEKRFASNKVRSSLRPGKVALPLPSMLKKPIGKEEYIEKINSFNARKNSINQASSIPKILSDRVSQNFEEYEMGMGEEAVYFQHVLQPDFSDFEQRLMIQKPMIIYLQQKPIRNPLKYYR